MKVEENVIRVGKIKRVYLPRGLNVLSTYLIADVAGGFGICGLRKSSSGQKKIL